MADGGWYIDELDPRLVRWHDGARWTEHVAERAEWEGLGAPPPPPDLWGRPRSSRRRVAVGTLAVMAAVLVAGVALAEDDGGDAPDAPATADSSPADDRGPAPSGTLHRSLDELELDGASGVPSEATEADDAPADSAGSSGPRRSTASTRPGGSTPTTVRRTETITRSQANPNPITQVGKGDQSSVGNSTATTIKAGYEPPPSTAPPSTTATTEPTTTTPTTSDPNPPP